MLTGRRLIAAPPRGWPGESRAALAIAVALGDVALHLLARRPSVVDGALYALAVALIVVLRRRSATAAFVATLALASFTGGAFVLLLWISYQAGRGLLARSGLVVALGAALGALGGQLATQPRAVSQVLATFLVFVALPMLAGRYVAQHERLVSTLEQNSRLRIARDMHDSLGHRLSLVSIQAAALEVSDLPPQHRQAVTELATSVRAAMDELYQMVATLRGSPTAAAPPRADAIERLASDFQSAGVAVGLQHIGKPRPLGDDAGEAAYRVAQEGLTNAAKHAPGHDIAMRVAWEPDALVLTITNPTPKPPTQAHAQHHSTTTHPGTAPPTETLTRHNPTTPHPGPPRPAAGHIWHRPAAPDHGTPPTGPLPERSPAGPGEGTPPAGPVAAQRFQDRSDDLPFAESIARHGLAGLEERVRQAGGFLDHRVEAGEFRLVAMLPYAKEAASRTRIVSVGVAAAVLMFALLPATMVIGVVQ